MTAGITSAVADTPITNGVKSKGTGEEGVIILDIRTKHAESTMINDIKTGLRPETGNAKTLPTLLLYDVNGLQLFEKITYLDEYYLTNSEIEVLEKYAERIAKEIPPNSVVLELGSG
jgi:uncharacterized SAM-dependent methyltransferase